MSIRSAQGNQVPLALLQATQQVAVGIIMADMGAAKCSSNHVPLLFWFSKYLSSPRFAEEETEAHGSRSPNLSLHSRKGSTVILTLQPVLLTKTLPLPIPSRQERTERAPSLRVTCCSRRLWSLGCPPVSYNLTPGPFSEKGTGDPGMHLANASSVFSWVRVTSSLLPLDSPPPPAKRKPMGRERGSVYG